MDIEHKEEILLIKPSNRHLMIINEKHTAIPYVAIAGSEKPCHFCDGYFRENGEPGFKIKAGQQHYFWTAHIRSYQAHIPCMDTVSKFNDEALWPDFSELMGHFENHQSDGTEEGDAMAALYKALGGGK